MENYALWEYMVFELKKKMEFDESAWQPWGFGAVEIMYIYLVELKMMGKDDWRMHWEENWGADDVKEFVWEVICKLPPWEEDIQILGERSGVFGRNNEFFLVEVLTTTHNLGDGKGHMNRTDILNKNEETIHTGGRRGGCDFKSLPCADF